MTTQSISIVVLSTDFDNLNEIRAALSTDSRAKLLSGGNDVNQIQEEIIRFKPSAAMIGLGAESDQAIRLIRQIKAECPQTAVITVGHETSSEIILEGLRAGSDEFLHLPINADELKTVLDRISEFCMSKNEEAGDKGRMTAIFSHKGGCGTSFLAANLARAATVRTALVDLNFESGDLPLFFGLDPVFSIANIISRRDELDESLISKLVTPCSESLDLVAAPQELDPIDEIKPEHVFEVLQRLREYYDHVVLDLRHTFDPITLMVLDQCDDIVLVFSLDLLAIRSAQRALHFFDREGYPEHKVKIVVNRWSKQIDWDLPEVEKYLHRKVAGTLTSHYPTVIESIDRGIPLVQSNAKSEIAREIRRFAQILSIETDYCREPTRSWAHFLKTQSEKILRFQQKRKISA
jgi:pilus assembly protein CpaE